MRLLAVVAVVVGLVRVAAADDRTCYAGKETMETAGAKTTRAAIVVRELDRGASEIRHHSWTDDDFEHERTIVFKVDPKAGTFELVNDAMKARGTGTLDGPAWRWTAYHAKTSTGPVTLESEGQLRGDTLTTAARIENGGKLASTLQLEARAFDCKELDQRRRALDPTSPSAVRSCYAGTATSSIDRKTRAAILVQTVDGGRIEVRWRLAGMKHDRIDVMKIDGDTVVVENVGPGKLAGKPGAWTGYSWSSHSAVVETVEGTLGGAHATYKLAMTGGNSSSTMTIDAQQFDCKQLADKRAALP